MSPEAFIGLGSNLERPRAQMERALRGLRERSVTVEQVSSLYRSAPLDAPPQPWFLNAVAVVRSGADPRALLAICQEIESSQGRRRELRHGPRTIDLDLLLFGDVVLDTAELTLPHPRMHLRRFVLLPLAEIAPHAVHPVLGLTVGELLDRCPDGSMVIRLGPLSSPA